MDAPKLTLYLAGDPTRFAPSIDGLRRAARERLGPAAELEVVDVLSDRERARADGVLVAPTLVLGDPRQGPRAFGELSDTRAALRSLGLDG